MQRPRHRSRAPPGWATRSSRSRSRGRATPTLITCDLVGVGSSDPVLHADLPALEARADGFTAVLDAVGSERAAFFASHVRAGHAAAIPDALLVELPGDEHVWFAAPDRDAALDVVEEFLTGCRAPSPSGRARPGVGPALRARGRQVLKGVPDEWTVFRVEDGLSGGGPART